VTTQSREGNSRKYESSDDCRKPVAWRNSSFQTQAVATGKAQLLTVDNCILWKSVMMIIVSKDNREVQGPEELVNEVQWLLSNANIFECQNGECFFPEYGQNQLVVVWFRFSAKLPRPVISSTAPLADNVGTAMSLSNQTLGHDAATHWAFPPVRFSESTSDGVVAWFGPLSFRSTTLCEVELVSGVSPDYRLTQM